MSHREMTSMFERFGTKAVTIALAAYAVVLIAHTSQMI